MLANKGNQEDSKNKGVLLCRNFTRRSLEYWDTIELEASECRDRNTLIASLFDKASPELKEKLVQSDENEVHIAITGLIDDAYLAFNSLFLWSYKHMKN
ncbi:MAG TPA: hypothetical protein PLM07_18290 [Candidatus Rifleibacterium sp.]|nr:hypothetical protein [Candidatus Rifleibacterium sp.]HPT47832.1 hypothetical protein [Candidatus Rifleibacterium sp.]